MSKLFNNRAKTLKVTTDWLKVVKEKTECKFHNKLLTVTEQRIITACDHNAFLWL